ncbi:DNA recombination protein RmuC [Thermomonas carbonis]|uniref:DNA recombination protein RmuC n=1 Tax=Thermomonas carbonis TaxID=1463158 RepID=A0A7G9ST35_9GAMM|nr:DNA recombination protein RmuC [Thermomonas carbonis]QNN71010.1 DNA recombination protein RmuC [Thermomonas carbonis]GHC03894.1 DNA recombination protein RmuC [Thermomonas carbonis]
MESQTQFFVVLLVGLLAVVLLCVLLFRKPEDRIEHALREERDRLASDLESERGVAQARAAEAARLGERVARLERTEAELASRDEELRQTRQVASELRAEFSAKTSVSQQFEMRADKAEALAESLRGKLRALEQAHAEALANLSHSDRTNAEMKAFLETAQERLSGVFAELAGKTFEERTQQAAKQSKGDIEMLLKPFSEQLSGFRSRVDMLYGEEAKERAALVGKIDELKTLNQDMAQRANELTRALKGSSKIRGDWGELMLENVLQGSGLVEGAHYHRQKSSTTEDGQRVQPDIVVNLPDERRIVVDSKVNLVAWQEAMNAATPEEQQEGLRRHSVALRQHIKELGEKNYPKVIGDGALEVTVAFVPIEGALSAALGFDASLQTYAFDQKIVFASPNTLMMLLRVVDRLWTRDKIQREAQEIARTGGLVLDSLINFLADFDNVGRQLDDARAAFNDARHKLSDSKQALIPRAQRLVELGAKGKKVLPLALQVEAESLVQVIGSLPHAGPVLSRDEP